MTTTIDQVHVISTVHVASGTYGAVDRVECRAGHYMCTLAVKRVCYAVDDDNETDVTREDIAIELALLDLMARVSAPSFLRYYGAAAVAPTHEALLITQYAPLGALSDNAAHSSIELCVWMFELLWSLMAAQLDVRLLHRDVRATNIVLDYASSPPTETQQCHYTLRQRVSGPNPGWERQWAVFHGPNARVPLFVDFGMGTWGGPLSVVNSHSRELATLPSPDLLFWPSGAQRAYSTDTWALGLVFFDKLTEQRQWPELDTRIFANAAFLDAARTLQYLCNMPRKRTAKYFLAIMLLQEVLGNGILPPTPMPGNAVYSALLHEGETRVFSQARLAVGHVVRQDVTDIGKRYGPQALDLLRCLLAWTEADRGAGAYLRFASPVRGEYHPALHALEHDYFSFLRVSADDMVVDAPATHSHKWYACNYHALYGDTRHDRAVQQHCARSARAATLALQSEVPDEELVLRRVAADVINAREGTASEAPADAIVLQRHMSRLYCHETLSPC